VGRGLLNHHQRFRDVPRPRVLGDLRLVASPEQVAECGHPVVPVLVRQQVVALLALELLQRAQLRGLARRRPCQRDRPPDAEVVADVGIVHGDDVVEA
jgi:hypothetical protein